METATPLVIGRPDGVLSVLPHSREDTWDRRASVLGFWVSTDFASNGSRGKWTARGHECGSGSTAAGSVATNVRGVDDARGVGGTSSTGHGTTCPGRGT